jgi:hypothetical protein
MLGRCGSCLRGDDQDQWEEFSKTSASLLPLAVTLLIVEGVANPETVVVVIMSSH